MPCKSWKNISVSSKLYAVIGFMAFLIAIELFYFLFAMNTLSSLRSFVTGESLWSKSQKDAVISLHKYARTEDLRYYADFKEYLKIPEGYQQARLALEKNPPDLETARHGFIAGRVHAEDVPGLVQMILKFHDFHYLQKALKIWREGDKITAELKAQAEELHGLIQSRAVSTQITAKLNSIDTLNDRLTYLEEQFSYTVGEGSRWLERVLMLTLIFAVLLVEGLGLILFILFGRVFSKERQETTDKEFRAPIPYQQKSLFLANMSHEFRTPLTAIVGFSELLKDQEVSEAERKTYTEVIHRTSENLMALINDILDLSKVEAGHLSIEKTHFAPVSLFQDLEFLAKAKTQDKSLRLEFKKNGPLPEIMHSDPLRVRQILGHIINNAIKFTDAGKVEVSFCEKNGFLTCEITDTGSGISWEKRQTLFENFSTGDNSLSRKNNGAGLGLALSKKIALLLGGDVQLVSSNVGEGSTFLVQIPTESRQSVLRRPKINSASADVLASKSILIVDDVEDNRLLIARILSKKGAKLTFATNGEDGLSKALTQDYDVILMDIQTPVMDGYTATRRLRQAGYQKPIIALTAHAMKDDRERCLAAGCTDYLTKPVHVETLVETILNHSDEDSF